MDRQRDNLPCHFVCLLNFCPVLLCCYLCLEYTNIHEHTNMNGYLLAGHTWIHTNMHATNQ